MLCAEGNDSLEKEKLLCRCAETSTVAIYVSRWEDKEFNAEGRRVGFMIYPWHQEGEWNCKKMGSWGVKCICETSLLSIFIFSGNWEERLSVESENERPGVRPGDALGLSGSTYIPKEHFGTRVAWGNIPRAINSVLKNQWVNVFGNHRVLEFSRVTITG